MPEAPRGRVLLAIAHEAIEHDDDPLEACAWEEPWLREWGATFVTLRLEGELCGCIGSIEPRRALGDDVAHNARAASRDSRFPRLARAMLPRLDVEVSLLSSREPVVAESEAHALSLLRPGLDGIVLEYGVHCATFLPQVWESLADPLEFLSELRRKARLPSRFWHPELRISRYTVEKFL
jgi:hypothetical protein